MRYSTHQVTEQDVLAVASVMRSDWLTCGPKIEEFEAALAEYVGAKYAVAVSSGTAALHLAYLAARADRVVTSPLTFVATANAALLAGASVGFKDVDPVTGNVAFPSGLMALGNGRLVLVPVHYAGRAAQIPAGLVIEDACHALGAVDYDGCSRVGSCAHSLATCFSFHAVKSVACGEGGAVTTNDEGFAGEVLSLRSHGRDKSGQMVALGFNYRITDMQCALGISQLRRLDAGVTHRAELAALYTDLLRHVDGVRCPEVMPGGAWHLYTARVDREVRDGILLALRAAGIQAQKHYSPPVHLHPYYVGRFGYKHGAFPNAEAWADSEISLPLHVQLTPNDVRRVVSALNEAV